MAVRRRHTLYRLWDVMFFEGSSALLAVRTAVPSVWGAWFVADTDKSVWSSW